MRRSKVIILGGVLAASSPVLGGEVFVGPGDVQAAIDAAVDGDIISLHAGIYYESIDFRGKAITVRRALDAAGDVVFDGSGLDTSMVVFDDWEDWSSVLEGIEFRHGSGRSVGTIRRGGAIDISLAGPLIRDCVFVGNSADLGGAIASSSGWPAIQNCEFRDNVAVAGGNWGGGAIGATSGVVRVEGSRFFDNSGTGLACGGAISAVGTKLRVSNSIFAGNSAITAGAIRHEGHDLWIHNCTIVDNDANVTSGGVFIGESDDVFITNSIIRGNAVEDDYFSAMEIGVPYYVDPTLHVYNCNITNAAAELDLAGGAGTNFDDDPKFVDRAGRNFRLTETSSCRDAGDLDHLPEDTLDWNVNGLLDEDLPVDADGALIDWSDPEQPMVIESSPRVVNSTVDVGAHEYQFEADPPEPTCEDADLTFDGDVGFDDLLRILHDWGDCPESCPSDISGDGAVEFTDLTVVLANWGPCP